MTNAEKARLRELLAEYVQSWEKSYPNLVLDEDIRLDEDGSVCYTTTAELLVFNLPREDLPKLHALAQVYMVFIDIMEPHCLSDECAALVVKSRVICPPIKRYGHEIQFETCHDDPHWFQWFGKEFFNIRARVSDAFWYKLYFNHDGLTSFDDDPPEPKPKKPKVVYLTNEYIGEKKSFDDDDLPF